MPASGARQPRSIVRVNGTPMAGWLTWEVDNNTYYLADTFRVSFSVGHLPPNYGPDWWTIQDQLSVEIFVGFPSDPVNFSAEDLTLLIYGNADELAWNMERNAFDLYGRDLTALLIDTKTSQKYANLKASDIATQLAKNHGLTPKVTATKARVGTYYQIDHVALQSERSEWDLLTWLASVEQMAVYVKGHELHFEPRKASSKPRPFLFQPPTPDVPASADGTAMTVTHALTLAKDIKVTVRSWNAKNKKGFVKTVEAKRVRNRVIRNAGRPITPTQEYFFTYPNLLPEQALQIANQKLAELSKHEVKLSIEGPADVTLSVADTISLAGTNTVFDQAFFPDSITRSFSTEDGLRWHIEAKNTSPESVPQP